MRFGVVHVSNTYPRYESRRRRRRQTNTETKVSVFALYFQVLCKMLVMVRFTESNLDLQILAIPDYLKSDRVTRLVGV